MAFGTLGLAKMNFTSLYTKTVRFLSSQAAPNFHVEPRLTPHNAVIRVYDEARNVIETHEHKGDFKEW